MCKKRQRTGALQTFGFFSALNTAKRLGVRQSSGAFASNLALLVLISMSGEWLTRGTVWLALSLYVAGQILPHRSAARWFNTLGCVAFLAHVACAFQFYHGWSHSVAYADTARQTKELTGWNSGAGLYINYLFALVWMGDVIWSWASYDARPPWITWSVRGFFWFMIFNGAVVFARGPIRGFGLLLCLALVGCWWPKRKLVRE